MTDLLSDFVNVYNHSNGRDSMLAIDSDGGADSFVDIAQIWHITGTDENAFEAGGYFII